MEKLKEYIHQILGKALEIKELSKELTNKLPFLFKNNFNFYVTHLNNHELILIQLKKEDTFNATGVTQDCKKFFHHHKKNTKYLIKIQKYK